MWKTPVREYLLFGLCQDLSGSLAQYLILTDLGVVLKTIPVHSAQELPNITLGMDRGYLLSFPVHFYI